ncbi:MAG: 6-carboxytetrahydropterin synthase [Phycisphaeraceae bacterium]|nr:6-carboxytetrahydropterin synthase [Phycisphaeraceae bacterium]
MSPRPDLSGSSNGFAGSPAPVGLSLWQAIDIVCRDIPDPTSGYVINIKDIDRIVRDRLVPFLQSAIVARPAASPEMLIAELARRMESIGTPWCRLIWRLSPYHAYEMHAADLSVCIVRVSFDFAAAHRLHNPALSDEENRRLFGKCNNPNGHGHNYRIEPAVEVSSGSSALSVMQIEQLVNTTLIERFDHRHLNEDTVEFGCDSGCNPTVENIARVFYELLAPVVASAGGRLRSMTVWETDRTSATFPA